MYFPTISFLIFYISRMILNVDSEEVDLSIDNLKEPESLRATTEILVNEETEDEQWADYEERGYFLRKTPKHHFVKDFNLEQPVFPAVMRLNEAEQRRFNDFMNVNPNYDDEPSLKILSRPKEPPIEKVVQKLRRMLHTNNKLNRADKVPLSEQHIDYLN